MQNLVELANVVLEEESMEKQVVRIAAKLSPGHDERKKRRGRLLELGMEAYEELRQISGSEEAAKEAEFRMHADQVMARVGAFNAAVIRDQEAEELAQMIADIEEGNEKLEESMKEIEEELGIAGKRKKEEDGRGC